MHRRAITLSITVAAVAALSFSCKSEPLAPADDNLVTFTATLNGGNENPVNATTGSGTFTGILDTVTNSFTYDLVFSGLSANVNNGHIHGPALPTVNAGTTINFNTLPGATFSFGLQSGTAHGVAQLVATNQITATMNGDSLKKLLFAGLTYANIHTTALPGGEIRGQITKQ